jgi:hypothetical protein
LNEEIISRTVAETENFSLWTTMERDTGEVLYHLELGGVTCHFTEDEWAEIVTLVRRSAGEGRGG